MRISDWSSDVCSSDLILAERHEIPVVQMRYLFDGGYASDTDGKLGRAGFALNMLGEGAGELGSLEFSAAKENLGARLRASASLDGRSARLSALKENLDESIALFADMPRAPPFAPPEINRKSAAK